MNTDQIINDFYNANPSEDLLMANLVAPDAPTSIKWPSDYKTADKKAALSMLK